ncbi:MAG: hypothetical protein QNK11_07785 [Legionella sp.]|nr:hypothetical protein [Legionella sp.]
MHQVKDKNFVEESIKEITARQENRSDSLSPISELEASDFTADEAKATPKKEVKETRTEGLGEPTTKKLNQSQLSFAMKSVSAIFMLALVKPTASKGFRSNLWALSYLTVLGASAYSAYTTPGLFFSERDTKPESPGSSDKPSAAYR